jgi:beta-N-acetylhexosaminidase
MSDDVSMGALDGSLGERARAAWAAGCDIVLHCNGSLAEREAVAAEAPLLAGEARRRADAALAARRAPDGIDLAEARKRFAALLAGRGKPAAARMAVS